MFDRQNRCPTVGCGSECVHPWLAAIIVVLASTLALIFPFLNAIGLKPNSSFFLGVNLPLTVVITLVWVISILLGCTRRHENEFVCFIDSFGIPGIVVAISYVGKSLGAG